MKTIILILLFTCVNFAQNLLLFGEDNLVSTAQSIGGFIYYVDSESNTKNANNKVTALTQLSGTSYTTTQADTSKAPTYTTSGLYFTTDDYMESSVGAALAGDDIPFTIIFKAKTINNSGAYAFCSLNSTSNALPYMFFRDGSGTYGTGWRDGAAASATKNFDVSTTAENILALVFDGSNLSLYKNNVQSGTTGTITLASIPYNNFSIGVYRNAASYTNYFLGYIKKVLIFNKALSTDQLTRIYRYL